MTPPWEATSACGGELFEAPAEPAYRPNLDKVRARLEKLLAEARAAQTMPWEPSQLSLYRLIFPPMTLWLPEEEAARYRLAFDEEMKRLEAACVVLEGGVLRIATITTLSVCPCGGASQAPQPQP